MNIKQLSAAMSAALGMTMAGTAMAQIGGPINSLPSDEDYIMRFSGATASAGFVRNRIIDGLCLADTITTYENDDDDYAIVCDVDPSKGVTAAKVMFVKEGQGGSGNGTTPVADNLPLVFPTPVTDGTFDPNVTCTDSEDTATGSGTAYQRFYNCSIPEVTSTPDIGLSDVEPTAFYDVNTPGSGGAFTSAQAAKITIKPLANLVFGIGVTKNLRNALQAAQFKQYLDPAKTVKNPCHPANWDMHETVVPEAGIDISGIHFQLPKKWGGTPNDAQGVAVVGDTNVCLPSLTRTELVGLWTGGLTHWDQLEVEGVSLIQNAIDSNAAAEASDPEGDLACGAIGVVDGVCIDIPTTNAVVALDNRRVHLCRRVHGSGTNAQFQGIFLNRPFGKNADGSTATLSALTPDTVGASFNLKTVVIANAGSSDLGRCLDDLDNAGNTSGRFTPGGTPLDNPRLAWGLGYQSTEKNVDLGRDYRFIRVDSYAPCLADTYAANYNDAAESTVQIEKVVSASDPDGQPYADAGDYLTIFDFVATATPFDIAAEDQNFLQPYCEYYGVLGGADVSSGAGWLTTPDDDGLWTTSGDRQYGNDAAVAEAPPTELLLLNPPGNVIPGYPAWEGPWPIKCWTRGGNLAQPTRAVDSCQVNRNRLTRHPHEDNVTGVSRIIPGQPQPLDF